MKISILTLFPKMIEEFFAESIVKRAQDKGLVEIEIINLRDFAIDSYGSVDEKPYGGGVGMILRADVVYDALQYVIPNSFRNLNSKKQMLNQVQHDKEKLKTIITSPKGKPFTQKKAQEFSKLDHLVIIVGHYEGIDERVLDYVDEEVSLGDFVMTGGEIAASAIVDSIVRLIPKVLRQDEATVLETFMNVSIDPPASLAKLGGQVDLIGAVGKEHPVIKRLKNKGIKELKLLEYPQYTRPEKFKGKKVPEVLLSGNHKEIEKWRLKKAFEETLKKRPDLLT